MIIKPIIRPVLRIILLSCLLVILNKISHSQTVRYEFEEVPFTREFQGFLGTSIVQDSDGFMWFSSNNGLYRYDGIRFKKYQYAPESSKPSVNDTAGLVYPFTFSLIEDNEGTLWFANNGFLTSFDRKTETFNHFTDTFIIGSIPIVLEGKNGHLWVGSDAGLSRFDKKNKTFRHFPVYLTKQPGSERNPVYKICEDNTGNLWIRHIYGIMSVFNQQTETFEYIRNAPSNVHNFLEDRSGRFWVVSQDGLYQLNRKSRTFNRYLYLPGDPNRLTNQDVVNMVQDNAGHFWINTYDGIYHYDENLEKLNFWRYPGEDSPVWNQYLRNTTRLIYPDDIGTIWFFNMNGICKLIKQFNNFTVYEPSEVENSQIKNLKTKNKIFLWSRAVTRDTSFSGFYMLDRKTHQSTKLMIDPEKEIKDYGFALTDHKGTFWIATKGRGLYRGNISADSILRFENVFSEAGDSSNLPALFLHRLFEDSKGRIWIEVRGHLPCYYDTEKDRIIHLVNNPMSKDKLPDIEGLEYSQGCIQSEMNSGILLASNQFHGIYAIIPPFIQVSENAVMPTDVIQFRSASGNDVILGEEMYQSPHDTAGIIWTHRRPIGFQKLTLLNKDNSNKFFVQSRIYTVKDGLPHSHVARFLEDNHGCFWLGTSMGLTKFDPFTETFTNYTVQFGLPTISFNSAMKSDDGELFFGLSWGGFISFDPDSMKYNSNVPPVMLTDLKINQQSISPWESPILEKLISYSDFIELSYNQNNIFLEYAALNYIQPDRNQYRYIMEGFNKDWIYAGNRTSVDYNNLKPGRYTFRVMGSNNDGIWNEEGAALQIIIHPPPWKTVWAYLIYGFILIVLILWYRHFLLNRAKIRTALEVERVEKEKIQEIDHMKSRFFANISHEFRTPLTLLLGPIEDLLKSKHIRDEKERNLFKSMQRNARRLQRLINQLLDLSKLETGKAKLQVSEGELTEYIRTIVLSFLSLAESKKIDYQYDIPDLSEPLYFDKDKLEKILTNLLSNAFKFTPQNGKVIVSIQFVTSAESVAPQFADIKVSDTGKGIPEGQLDKIFDRFYQVSDSDTRDAEGTGIGLALTRELVDIYHGKINVESENGKGSTFRVQLPVSRDQFNEEEIVTIAPGEDRSKEPVISEYDQPETERTEIKESQISVKAKVVPIILIVEDNIDLRNYISKNLGSSYQTLHAENGNKGLELAIEHIPDLVISDVMMPEMDGMEMCRQLKTDERTNHIPVIMLTARADRDSKLEGLETGADDYIIKPFDAAELQVRVRNIIEQRRRLREKLSKKLISESLEGPPVLKDQFLNKLMENLTKHISDPDFTIKQLGNELYMSWSQLYRKVAAVTGMTPNELLQMIRMKHAARLLHSPELNIAQVMYQVGMRNTSHFAQSFRKYYGKNPSEYRQSQNN